MNLINYLLSTIFIISNVSGQRRRLIQDLIDTLKNRPNRKDSINRSWSSDRDFIGNIIGTGGLPLQDHKVDDVDGVLLETRNYNSPSSSSRYDVGQQRQSYDDPPQPSRPLPGQFSRNRPIFRNPDSTFFQTQEPSKPGNYFDTWPSSVRQRNKRSPYRHVKIRLPNPFYYSGRGNKRRVRVKTQIIPLHHVSPQPQISDRVDRYDYRDDETFVDDDLFYRDHNHQHLSYTDDHHQNPSYDDDNLQHLNYADDDSVYTLNNDYDQV